MLREDRSVSEHCIQDQDSLTFAYSSSKHFRWHRTLYLIPFKKSY